MATRCARDFSPTCRPIRKKSVITSQVFRVGADFTAQAYVSLRKMADVESKPARKKRSFDEKEINLLISQWSEYPCLFDKTNPDHKDQNKRDIARQQIAKSLIEALDYEKGADKFITGIFEF